MSGFSIRNPYFIIVVCLMIAVVGELVLEARDTLLVLIFQRNFVERIVSRLLQEHINW